MRTIRPLRRIRSGWPFVVTAFLAILAGAVSAQRLPPQGFPPDAVEDLRQALKIPIRDHLKNPDELTYRKDNLTKRVEGLHTLGEMRRALQLQGWRDDDNDEKVAAVDQPIRAHLFEQFEARLRDVMKKGNSLEKLAAAAMVGEMGINVRGVGENRGGAARPFAPDLAEMTKSSDAAVASAAARALGKINPDPNVAVPALTGLLHSPDPQLRRAAAASLADIMRTATLIAKGRSIKGIDPSPEELVKNGCAVVPAAGSGTADADAEVRRLSIEAIENAAIALHEMVLEPRQEFPAEGRKWTADERMEVEEYRKGVEEEQKMLLPLTNALRDQAQAIKQVLSDPVPQIRLAARRALEEVGDARLRLVRRISSVPAIPADKGAAADPDPTALPVVRSKQRIQQDLLAQRKAIPTPFVLVMQKPADAKASDPLLEMLQIDLGALAAGIRDPDVQVRLAALDVMEWMGSDAAPAASALVTALCDPNRFVRWEAARVIGHIAPVAADTAVPALGKLLCDPDLDIRLTTAATLAHYGPAALAALPAVAATVNKGDAEIRIASIQTITSMGPDASAAIPALIAALQAEDTRVRRAAAEALSTFGPAARDAEAALRQDLVEHDDPEERKAVSDAILSIVTATAPPPRVMPPVK